MPGWGSFPWPGLMSPNIPWPGATPRSITDYLNLVTSEHRASTKFIAWATALLQPFIDVQTCADSIPAAFDLDTAIGAQLDILGQILGAARTVGFQPTGSVSPVLDDATYRILLKSKVLFNQWDGQILSIEEAWGNIFPGGHIFIQDNENMTMTVTATGITSYIQIDLIENGYIVPVPEGVGVNYIFGTAPYFGFDSNNDVIAGFDAGYWT
jgi:hypothetical protein